MPFYLSDQMRDEFDYLEYDSMTIMLYETHFHALCRYATINIPIESEKIMRFVKGFVKFYQSGTTQVVVSKAVFRV